MNYLLDTHIFLWAITSSPKISSKAREAILDGNNIIYVSAITPWEISIKKSIGKLRIPPISYEAEFEANRFTPLSISVDHTVAVEHLPMYHRDPFDRLLIAQAKFEKLTLISDDATFHAYDVKVIG